MTINDELVIRRTFSAPIEVVWSVWTDSKHLTKWWGPAGMPIKVLTFEFHPQGIFHYCLTTPQKQQMYGKFIFIEISKPNKLVFRNSFTDENGTSIPNPMTSNWPLEVENTLTLESRGSETTLKLVGIPYNATEEEIKTFNESKMSLQQGFRNTFAQLDEYLLSLLTEKPLKIPIPIIETTTNKELVIVREFNAPKELVFRMFTESKLLKLWWGPHMFTNPVCDVDAQVGGKILVHMQGPDGLPNPMGGMFYEVVPYEKLVFTTNTFLSEGADPEMENLNTITLEERKKGFTRLTLKVQIIKAISERSLMALTGMTEGWLQS